jgi:CheY-like chemotaxis protein
MKILIIDDDKMTVTALEKILKDLGHTAHHASDSEEAIPKITSGEYDVVICDIMMPGISGLSLLNVLRTVHLSFIPVIMMSSLNNEPLVEAALKAGANDFISKPVTIEELSSKLSKYDKINQ